MKMPDRCTSDRSIAQLGLDVALVGVELVELCVDLLRAVRRRQDRHDDQQEQPPEPERRDRPCSESHSCWFKRFRVQEVQEGSRFSRS